MAELSLLASLSSKFRDKPENIATAALEHILGRSEVAREVLTSQAFLTLDPRPSVAFYRSQSQEDLTRPDLAGLDQNGNEVVLIEAKFWAGLTDQQPNGYLERLDDSRSSSLCFIVPEARRSSLWLEVLERVAQQSNSDQWLDNGKYSKKLSSHLMLTMISWQGLLHSMIEATSAAGDLKTTHDIEQLVSFCEYLEQQGFIPFNFEELGPTIPRLLTQLTLVVDQIVDLGAASGRFSTKGFSATSARERFTRYFEVDGVRIDLSVHYDYWIKYGISPVWLRFQGGNTGPEQKAFWRVREQFRRFELETSRRLFISSDGSPLFAIRLAMDVDIDRVVEEATSQIDEIVRLVNSK